MATAQTPALVKDVAATPVASSRLVIGAVLGIALFGSGAAGLVNQVVWQRALRVFLGGSETICSMIVVLVFMGGLGIGSIWMSRRVSGLRNPLRVFALFELILAAVNILVCLVLTSELTTSVFALQQLALSVGLPLLALYGVLATLVLAGPCLLMGATMPLAAEACQRNLGLRDPRVLGLLFGVNTLGSVLGTVVASGWMIAELGQARSLLLAATLNAAAGVLLACLVRAATRYAAPPTDSADIDSPESTGATAGRRGWRPSPAELLAFGLGFCSLSFEMYLFRLVPLRHQPLPFTFAAVLAGFLLFWSAGAALASCKRRLSFPTALRLGALTTVLTLLAYKFDQPAPLTNTTTLVIFVATRCAYFVPCLFFGYLFSLLTQDAAKSWGRDVGRIAGWNTFGSCLGTVLTTFVGYEVPFFIMVVAIALFMYAMQEYVEAAQPGANARRAPWRWATPVVLAVGGVGACFFVDPARYLMRERLYSGRDGVLFVTPEGQVIWDGLWHSGLTRDHNHLGTRNWYAAVCPVLAHPTGDVKDVCVIGVCTGITAGTLAKLDSVERVDGYDITHVLKQVYRDYPDGTLNVATDPKVNLIWQDARTGLALNPQKYDIIQTQPLYLKQSGSAQLNSVEFYRLVSARLKPGGVFCLYSNGTPEQAFVVRETAAQAFPHSVSFKNGYLLILSNDPIDVSAAALTKRLERADPLLAEIRAYPETATAADILKLLDPPFETGDGQLIITDDFPIVEYPEVLGERVRAKRYPFKLPDPR